MTDVPPVERCEECDDRLPRRDGLCYVCHPDTPPFDP